MLERRYGITGAEYDMMFAAQQGACAICGVTSDRALHVDHDHTTGRVRALLCFNCNIMLGYAHEDTSILRAAIEYLETI